ncbi:hypothetical protein KDA_28390 [Dictyobacter alpinus]|uniref:Uncharacterized protein n=1 Tax=Dictyobacter alpinus TaxID=2014873 RepID=A0A402B7M1_9CHLR|nr:hypothetical protein [Dictyobacter alpinus]GCE27355.1 hypothetical protein KDA_28390 [Dictyobacter alpinus]
MTTFLVAFLIILVVLLIAVFVHLSIGFHRITRLHTTRNDNSQLKAGRPQLDDIIFDQTP